MALTARSGRCLVALFVAASLASCGVVKLSSKGDLVDGEYRFRHQGEKYQKVNVEVADDTLVIRSVDGSPVAQRPGHKYFIRNSVDIDIAVAPFKYRPGVSGFPRQMNANFNGNLFVGYRWDRFNWMRHSNSVSDKITLGHTAFTIGLFGGLGAAAINPWTTNYQVADEYDGFVLTRGAAAMVAVRTFTAGFAVGFDYLTDRDKDVWIYQNKPWYGVILGVNIN